MKAMLNTELKESFCQRMMDSLEKGVFFGYSY